MSKYLFLLTLFFFLAQPDLFPQTLEWIPLPTGANNEGCTSTTDCNTGTICFGLRYTPTLTGFVSSYTFNFLTDCGGQSSLTVNSASCTVTDNSEVFDDCASGDPLLLLVASGNTGNFAITSGVPVILHQVCIDLSGGSSLDILEDDFAQLEVSVDLDDDGDGRIDRAETDVLNFVTFTADASSCTTTSTCENTELCSVSFGTGAGQVSFAANANGNLVDGTSFGDAGTRTFQFDVYDEANEDCAVAGGLDDIIVETRLFNTDDVNNNAFIDALGGGAHKLVQDGNGITGDIPLGGDNDSETSSGDVRGYEIKVRFAGHLGIRAGQLTVNLEGLNSPGTTFESASLHFLNPRYNPFAVPGYSGYYNGETDLSGNCQPTAAGLPWSSPGPGAIVFADTRTVMLTDPCSPATGSGGFPGMTAVNAAASTGLDAQSFVGGFVLRVYGEDVAAPTMLDDGSATGSEDALVANRTTNTDAVMVSSLLGYTVRGCVFEPASLPVTWASFTAVRDGKVADMEWVTSAEDGHDFFTVEWGTDNATFTPLGEVRRAVHERNGERRYAFIHEQPASGTNYYRIKQTDLDGQFSYSPLRSVWFPGEAATEGDFSLFPNPARTEVTLGLAETVGEQSVQLFNTAGQLLRERQVVPGVATVTLSLEELPAGVYVVRVGDTARRLLKH